MEGGVDCYRALPALKTIIIIIKIPSETMHETLKYYNIP